MTTVAEVEAEISSCMSWVADSRCSRFRRALDKAHTDACFLPRGRDLSLQARQDLLSAKTFLISALHSVNARLEDSE